MGGADSWGSESGRAVLERCTSPSPSRSLTDQTLRVPPGTSRQPLEQVIDVSGFAQVDLLLGAIEVSLADPGLTVRLLTGMNAASEEGWTPVAEFSTLGSSNTWERRSVRDLARYIRIEADVEASSATFSLRGLARRRAVPFQPTELPGLAAWYTADRGLTYANGRVSAWADQSGNGRHLVQATLGAQPGYDAAGVNLRPCVTFDGSDDTLQCASFPYGSTGLTCLVAMASVSAVSAGEVVAFDRTGSGAVVVGAHGATTAPELSVGGATAYDNVARVALGEPVVVAVRTVPGAARGELWVNGTFRAATNLVAHDPASAAVLAVGGVAGHAFANARVRQVVWYDRTLTDLELAIATRALLRDVGRTQDASGVQAVTPPRYVATWSAAVVPTGVTYTRSGTWWLIDDAAQSHLTSYGADAWGVEVEPSGATSAVVVPGYSNALTAPRAYANASGNWQTGTASNPTAGDQNGPDGATLSADWASTTSTQYGPYYVGGAAAQLAYSGWGRAHSGTGTWQCGLWASDGSTRLDGFATTVTTTWQRQAAVAAAVLYVLPVDGRFPSATANSVVVDCQQLVSGVTYVPPFTTGTVGSVGLAVAGADLIGASGYFDVELGAVTALEAATAGSDQYLLYLDASNHLKLRASDHKVVLTLGGSAVAVSAAQSYAAGTDLGVVRVWSLASGCGFTFGGTTTSAGAAGTTTAPSTAYVGAQSASSGVFPCRVKGVMVGR